MEPPNTPTSALDPSGSDEILRQVELRRSELVRLTTEFVAFPTVNPPGTELVS